MQIRTRLTLRFLLMAAGILAAVLLVVYGMFKKNMEDSFYKGLESKIDVTAKAMQYSFWTLKPLPPDWIEPENDTLPYRDNLSIYDNAYTRIFSGNSGAVPVSVRDLEQIYQNGEARFRHFNLDALGKKIEAPDGFEFVMVAEGYCDPGELKNLSKILIISFLIGIFLVAVSGWYYAGKALEPVKKIVIEVAGIQPSDLSRRVERGKNSDELDLLSETFNHLLERVEKAFQMQKMFVSNVSHELKNPLTAIRSQLDVALQRERAPEAYRKALQSVLDDVLELSETEQKLLHLARLYNNPNSIPLAPVRLDELLWQAADNLKKRHPQHRSFLEFTNMPEDENLLYVQANEPLLRMAVLNLMNNGCKYSPDHQVFVRAFFKEDGSHEIEIFNHGQPIPEAEKQLIFEPFYRSPRHLKIKGTGIGLSLVKSILNLHQIAVSVESPKGGGVLFRLVFP